jgi:hypothetical protein
MTTQQWPDATVSSTLGDPHGVPTGSVPRGPYPREGTASLRERIAQAPPGAVVNCTKEELDAFSASRTQIGGTHYSKLKIQPWDYVAANDLGYFEGSVVKYVTRWRDKGGVEDLKKARHFLDKLIEVSQ